MFETRREEDLNGAVVCPIHLPKGEMSVVVNLCKILISERFVIKSEALITKLE